MDDIALSLQEITANSKKLPNFLFSSILWKQKTPKITKKNKLEEPTNQTKNKQTKTTKTKQTKKICVPAHGYDTL